jgi:hypothetical protein
MRRRSVVEAISSNRRTRPFTPWASSLPTRKVATGIAACAPAGTILAILTNAEARSSAVPALF